MLHNVKEDLLSSQFLTYKRLCAAFPFDMQTQVENHIPEVIAPNEPDIPHTEDTEGPPDLINTEGTHEQNVQNDQIITQPTDIQSGNNTEVSGSIIESLIHDVIQSHILNQASTSSHPVPQDRWSRDQHIQLGEYHCLLPLPYGKIAIGSKWVFKNKKDKHGITTKNKARLVAQGYSQEEGINYDKTLAPVARMEAIRIFHSFATYMNFKVYQMHVKSAFLNGKLKEEVYVKEPPGFESSEFPDYVCKLDKALYGLKQAPRECTSNTSMTSPIKQPSSLQAPPSPHCLPFQLWPLNNHSTPSWLVLAFITHPTSKSYSSQLARTLIKPLDTKKT
ncbi:retrovirus-related pol polyprotein from transposon TNT 1-94 [Tanacetum coccineum]